MALTRRPPREPRGVLVGTAMLIALGVPALADQFGTREATAFIRSRAPRVLDRFRFPDQADLKGDWKFYAERHGAAPIFAWGDFNGDGRRDLAFLLPRRDPAPPGRRQPADRESGRGTGYGLFCLLSQPAGAYRLLTLDEDEDSLLWSAGVAAVPPGRYPTLCGLASGTRPECQEQPVEIVLAHDAVHAFGFETSGVFYSWDPKKRGFRKVWVSD